MYDNLRFNLARAFLILLALVVIAPANVNDHKLLERVQPRYV